MTFGVECWEQLSVTRAAALISQHESLLALLDGFYNFSGTGPMQVQTSDLQIRHQDQQNDPQPEQILNPGARH